GVRADIENEQDVVMNERKPGVAFFATLFLVASVLLYPVTFGVAVWLTARGFIERTTVESVYRPLLWIGIRSPAPVWTAIHWWGEVGVPAGDGVELLVSTPQDDAVWILFGTRFLRLGSGTGALAGGLIGNAEAAHSNELSLPTAAGKDGDSL